MLIVAGCGGGGAAQEHRQVVRGDGFRFDAPAGWTVTRSARRVAAAAGDIDRVEVTTFRLVKAYRPALFAAATGELDRVAAQLARQLRGRVAAEETVRVDGRAARSYRIEYAEKAQEITFLLEGRREYQLLCRRDANGSRDACAALVTSFRFA